MTSVNDHSNLVWGQPEGSTKYRDVEGVEIHLVDREKSMLITSKSVECGYVPDASPNRCVYSPASDLQPLIVQWHEIRGLNLSLSPEAPTFPRSSFPPHPKIQIGQ